MDIHINTKNTIIPMYEDVLDDVLDHKHTHYVFSGGRGSTKSSFLSCLVPLLLIKYSNIHACVFRKVANTIKTSVFAQMEWGIAQLGLSEYFKVTQTPMSITYIPTGQKIMFFGLDDAGKVKSIKLPFGYIGITWFEELDQFAGENELRKVTQSTMRGGDKFWDFRSFNPPISNLNWANEYAEKAEQFDDTLIVRNTYLDVPKDWLGEQFFDEAEQLKQCNPRAYAHEYLGQAVGTGGTLSGVGNFLKSKKADVKVVAVEPQTSPVLSEGHGGPHKIQGIGAGFVPDTLDTKVYDEILPIANEAAFSNANDIAKTEGILVGISSGAALAAAIELAKREENAGKTIVALFPDTGERYLSTGVFNS